MLLQHPDSLSAIARLVGGACGKQSVYEWRSGRKTPAVEMRARMQSALGIPAESWSHKAGRAPSTVASYDEIDLIVPRNAAHTTLADCLELHALIRRERKVDGLLVRERLRVTDAELRILALRARLESAQRLGDASYVRKHPAWKRTERVLVDALAPFPAAAKAVREAIARALAAPRRDTGHNDESTISERAATRARPAARSSQQATE